MRESRRCSARRGPAGDWSAGPSCTQRRVAASRHQRVLHGWCQDEYLLTCFEKERIRAAGESAIQETRSEEHGGLLCVDSPDVGIAIDASCPTDFHTFREYSRKVGVHHNLVGSQGSIHEQRGEVRWAQQCYQEASAFRVPRRSALRMVTPAQPDNRAIRGKQELRPTQSRFNASRSVECDLGSLRADFRAFNPRRANHPYR